MVAIEFLVIALLAMVSSASIQTRQPQARVISSCTVPNTVALTFDDGPYIWLQNISDTLTAAGAKGTFFFNGNNWDCIYDPDVVPRVLYAFNQGHQLCSHTWSHPDLTTLSWDQINNQMWLIEEALQKITGTYPAFLRPPYGNYNDLVLQAGAVRNQTIIMWDFDSGDSTGSTPAQSQAAYDAFIATQPRPSTLLALNHETYITTVQEVLPYAIQKLQAAGYNLVTLAECLNMPPYQSVQAPGVRDSTWTCNQSV